MVTTSKQEKKSPFRIKKRTSIGRKHAPKNKSKRANWKPYRRQG